MLLQNHQNLPFPQKHTPRRFDEVFGNSVAVNILTRLVANRSSRIVLLHGPSGTGKTTLANITAHSMVCYGDRQYGYEPCGQCEQCQNWDVPSQGVFGKTLIQRRSAATFASSASAIDTVYNDLSVQYGPYIINEIDRHKGLQTFLLERFEKEPPNPIILTTANIGNVDAQLRGRCIQVRTERLTDEQMSGYLRTIAQKEGYELTDAEVGDILMELARNDARGQVRDALQILEAFLLVRNVG